MEEEVEGRRAEIGLLGRQHTGHLLDVLGSLLNHDVHGVVEGDDTDEAAVGVDDGNGHKVVARERLGDFLAVGQRAHGDHVLVHDVGDLGVVVAREQEVLDRDRGDEALLLGHIAGVDGLLVDARAPDAPDGLADRHRGSERDVLRGHDRAGGVLRVLQDLVDLPAHLRVGLREDALHHVGGHLLDKVGCIVDVELVDDLAQLRIGEAADQELLPLGIELGERLGRRILGKQAEEERHAVLFELLEHGCDIGWLDGDQHIFERLVFLLVEKDAYGLLERHVMRRHDDPPPLESINSGSWRAGLTCVCLHGSCSTERGAHAGYSDCR